MPRLALIVNVIINYVYPKSVAYSNVIAACGVCMDVTSSGGTIQSRNFPDDYDGFGNGFGPLDCIFAIDVCPEKKIQLTFTQFVVESCCDTVTVSHRCP